MGFQFPFSLLGVRSLSYPEEALRLDCRDKEAFNTHLNPRRDKRCPEETAQLIR
jgi:hypothetical protein